MTGPAPPFCSSRVTDQLIGYSVALQENTVVQMKLPAGGLGKSPLPTMVVPAQLVDADPTATAWSATLL